VKTEEKSSKTVMQRMSMNYPKGISVPKSAQLVIDRFRPRCTAGLLPKLATALKRGIVRKWAWCCTWYVL
jgi:hypothetical protein